MCYAPRDVESIFRFDMGSGESYSLGSFRRKVQRSRFGTSSERQKVRLGMNNNNMDYYPRRARLGLGEI